MESLVFSFNVVMPVFLVIGLGFFLRTIGILNESFVNTAVKFNFKVALPVLLFKNIYSANFGETVDPRFLMFTFSSITGVVLILWLIVPLFVRDKKKASAMIHTMFRSNFLLLGFPLAVNMFGEANLTTVACMIPIVIPAFNFFAVVLLTAFDENGHRDLKSQIAFTVAGILKNPLIIASALAILCQLASLRLPRFLEGAVSSVADLGTPLALITLGAQLDIKNVAANLRYTLPATLGRLIAVPVVVVMIAIVAGYRGYELGGIFILFSSPSAVSCYVMSKEMNSDCALTADVVLLTTFFSMFTIFAGISLLKTFALI